MEFTGILDLHKNPNEDTIRPVFYTDLNIDRILSEIFREWGEEVGEYYYFPADGESEDYRRAVYRDIRANRLYDALYAFRRHIMNAVVCNERRDESEIVLQKAAWNIYCAAEYTDAVLSLKAALCECGLKSAGMRGLFDFLCEYTSATEFEELRSETCELSSMLSDMKLRITFENNRFTVESLHKETSGDTTDYEAMLHLMYPDNNRILKTPFDETDGLTKLERSLLSVFVKKEPSFFSRAEAFEKKHTEYMAGEFLKLSRELGFYLSFYRFEIKFEAKGLAFSSPSVDENAVISATGLYDLALACENIERNGEPGVVSNDFRYEGNESFFVLTGPNQGGKTTFARSLGQLVFFTKMGLEVPAASANLHYFNDLLTHFSVEESVETGRGKLKDELIRLAPMMEAKYDRSFIVINELFTTAANYDACIMGKKVLERFIGQSCMGIYVTHLPELCDAHESVTGINAVIGADGHPSFKISREKSECAEKSAERVEKHRLGYDQLCERLKNLRTGQNA